MGREMNTPMQKLGIELGASKVKLCLLDEAGALHALGRPHHGRALETLRELLGELSPKKEAAVCVCGNLSAQLTGFCPIPRMDDIPAIAAGVRHLVPQAGCAVEIGSQSARFLTDLQEKMPQFAINEHCAGGTGSFFEDQMSRLGLRMEEYSTLVAKAKSVPRLSGRCAVFAKTDIIHRQQEGVPTEDILLGLCYAMVRNYKATIVRQLPVQKPLVFCGGVTKNAGVKRALLDVFKLKEDELIIPKEAEFAQALGAALEARSYTAGELLEVLFRGAALKTVGSKSLTRLTLAEGTRLCDPVATGVIPKEGVALGIDIGSTSTDLVLVGRDHKLVDFQYLRTAGDPEGAVRRGLASIKERFGEITFLAVGVTGSGRERLGRMMGADAVRDEITAQARAAAHYVPEADTVFEIGGQDSKYISLANGEVSDFQMNKICAAGTGSFVEEQAVRMNVSLATFGELALKADAPADLGERCTVFIETAIAQARAAGTGTENIAAGLCHSIVSNYLHKVVANKPVGERIVLQGGVCYNPGIVAAFQSAYGKRVQVSPVFSVSGAFGAALLALEAVGAETSAFLGFDFPSKEQKKTVSDAEIARNREFYKKAGQLARQDYDPTLDPKKKTVGVPLVLILFKFFPLVNQFFKSLGYNVLLSDASNEETVRRSQEAAQGETCYPVKLIYGHMLQLADAGVDYIFLPNIHTIRHPHAHAEHNYACPYMQTAGRMIFDSLHLKERGITLINPVFDLDIGVQAMAKSMLGVGKSLGFSRPRCMAAMVKGGIAVQKYMTDVEKLGADLLARVQPEDKILVLITRNYGVSDPILNLGIPELLLRRGCKLITLAHIPGMSLDISGDYPHMYWPFGDHLLSGAKLIKNHPNLYAVYVTNHGCGPDTLVSHLFKEEMGDKPYLQIEVDEHYSPVGVITRIEAFLNSIGHRPPAPLPKNFNILDVAMHPASITDTATPGRTLYIPDIGLATPYVQQYYAHLGLRTRPLVFDKEAYRLGRAEMTSKEYLPMAMLAGAALKVLQDEAPEAVQFLLPFNLGADADGQYARVLRAILDRRGYGAAGIVGPVTERMPQHEKEPDLLFRALVTGDLLYAAPQKARRRLAPAEIPTWEGLMDLAKAVSVETNTGRRLAVVGTPLCVTSLDEGVLQRLEQEGERIVRMPLSEYLWFLWKENAHGSSSLLTYWEEMLIALSHTLGNAGCFSEEPSGLAGYADELLPDYAGANGRYRLAKAQEASYGNAAVLHLYPLYENTAMVLQLSGMDQACVAPLLQLPLDGAWEEAGERRLSSFLYYV